MSNHLERKMLALFLSFKQGGFLSSKQGGFLSSKQGGFLSSKQGGGCVSDVFEIHNERSS